MAWSVTRDLETSVEVWEISTGSVVKVWSVHHVTDVLDVHTTHSHVLMTMSV